ncbi:HET-domain-containing protein [Stipitochalara longipes BDJ]|nr:HET-domain-containing protein [Stipitochalara longipes BDJ]
MRLLNAQTLQLEEFWEGGSTRPKYAILSHTWGSEEVTLQEMQGNTNLIRHKSGFSKIRDSCDQARRDQYDYVWVDTCCIDKTSSTELAEAINSMYQWYKDSAVCYAYLADVRNSPDVISQFRRSRWFTRGWTLQELLAPSRIKFFDCNWSDIGNKADYMKEISEITGIDLYALAGGDLQNLSVARRMSWAASRQTTRLEDIAYCLLGIFQISMPLLYGEGARAFQRLQEAIMNYTPDQSLFAWRDESFRSYNGLFDDTDTSERQGLLTRSPEAFKYCKSVAQFYAQTPRQGTATPINSGIRIDLLMARDQFYGNGRVYVAVLDCPIGNIPGQLAGIRLLRLSPTGDHYARIDMPRLFHFAVGQKHIRGFDPTISRKRLVDVQSGISFLDWTMQSIFIKQETQVQLLPAFWFLPSSQLSERICLDSIEAYPPSWWDRRTLTMQPQGSGQGTKKIGALYVDYFKADFILIFGVTWGQVPWCVIKSPSSDFRTKVADNENGSRLKYIFEQFSATEIAERPTSSLYNPYDSGKKASSVKDLPPYLDDDLVPEFKEVWHCKETGLSISVETVTVSGRETHVLQVDESSPGYLHLEEVHNPDGDNSDSDNPDDRAGKQRVQIHLSSPGYHERIRTRRLRL